MPIIMLTGATAEEDIVSGFEAGANDFVVKPFRGNELLARVQAQLRRFDTSEDAVFTIGPYAVRPAAKLLVRTNTKQHTRLNSKETESLNFLYHHANHDVSHQVLRHAVWGYNAGVMTHTLETHVYRLRHMIESDPTRCRLLMSAPGSYRLDPAPI
jgi:DNA-binding response OmpR family regulator